MAVADQVDAFAVRFSGAQALEQKIRRGATLGFVVRAAPGKGLDARAGGRGREQFGAKWTFRPPPLRLGADLVARPIPRAMHRYEREHPGLPQAPLPAIGAR